MKLKVILPARVLLEQEVVKVVAEAPNGSFCLLPRHIDFVAALVPGILSYAVEDGTESYMAVDEGVLIKCGPEVTVSTWNAVVGPHLGELKAAVQEQFRELDVHERKARSALGRLEANLVRRVLEWEGRGHG